MQLKNVTFLRRESKNIEEDKESRKKSTQEKDKIESQHNSEGNSQNSCAADVWGNLPSSIVEHTCRDASKRENAVQRSNKTETQK